MTAPVNPQWSTEWFPKWTHNYFKLMDLKGSSILISLTLAIARLILGCQFSGCYHRKMLNCEHHTLFLWTKEGCWAQGKCACSTGFISWASEVMRTERLNHVSGMDLGAWVLAVAKYGKLGKWLPVKVATQWSQRGAGVGPSVPPPERGSWVGHSTPCPWEVQLGHSCQGHCKAHCCITKCLLTSAPLQPGKAGSGAGCAQLRCLRSDRNQSCPSPLLLSLQTLLFTAFLSSHNFFFFKGAPHSPSFGPSPGLQAAILITQCKKFQQGKVV